MNSNPISPSGINAIAPTVSAAQTAVTEIGCFRAKPSTRSPYQTRVRSKARVKASITRGGRQFESSDQLPASEGVTVNDTASEVSVAITTTTPNSARKRPTMPGRNAIGRKTTTSTSVITTAAAPISLRPRIAAVRGASPPS